MSQLTEDLVKRAKNKDEQAMMDLLTQYGYNGEKRLSKYLGKYYSLLVYGKLDLKDKDTRRFMQLYMSHADVRENMRYHYQSNKTATIAFGLSDFIQSSVKEKLDREDVKQSLIYLFIEKVHKYKKQHEKIDFGGYLFNSFRYDVYRYLQKTVFSEDVLNQYDYLSEDVEQVSDITDFTIFEDHYYKDIIQHDNLNVRWTNGHTHELFECLTAFERTILKMYYWDNYGDREIAESLGLHINTIFKKRHKIVEILNSEYEFYQIVGELDY